MPINLKCNDVGILLLHHTGDARTSRAPIPAIIKIAGVICHEFQPQRSGAGREQQVSKEEEA